LSDMPGVTRSATDMRIGILGGTFNPPHYGHLLAAESARECFGLQKVLFIPSGNPPHKSRNELADAEDRFSMVEEAVRTNPWFEASRIEIDRHGPTYSVDTLKELKAEYGEGTCFYFIIGTDIVNELVTWKEYEKVFAMCEFIEVTRPDTEADRQAERSQRIRQLTGDGRLRISTIRIPRLEISSTDIRERVTAGRSIKYMTPEGVEEYIKKNRLYI
jgi:nicotinate-nucleotide adenylyltransferase